MLDTILDPANPVPWVIIAGLLAGAIAVIYRPFSTYIKFVYPNAKYEAIGNPYITERELNKLIENKNINGFKEMLNTNKDYQLTGENIYDLQKALDDHLIKTIEQMKKDNSRKMKYFYDTYIEKIDLYLIKHIVKNRLRDINVDKKIIENALLKKTKNVLQDLIDADKNSIPEILKNYGLPDEIRGVLKDEKDIDFLKLDTLFDIYIINKFKQTSVPYKCEDGRNKFINYLVDTLNVKNVLRAKQLGYNIENCKKLFLGEGQEIALWKFNELSKADSVSQMISSLQGTSYYEPLKNSIEDYNRENSVQVLENALDRNFLNIVRDISMQNYVTIGPTIRFLVSKEFEIRNLKTIVKGIGENMPPDFIKSVLVTGGET